MDDALNKKPLLRGHFHQAMFFVSLGACVLLFLKTQNTLQQISVVIYTFGLLSMFGVSALYHRIYWNHETRSLLKKIDHAAIYIMIAGTFTPVCLLALSAQDGQRLLMLIWIVALVGVIQSLWFVHLPKMISSLLYIGAGYLVLPYLPELSKTLGATQMAFLLGGGVVYSIGGLCYGLKWPHFNPHIFGYHEFFHILVSLGALIHFALVYTLIS